MKQVNYALIPAAGLGTRFLPATKSIPKEMLPIVDKPGLLLAAEEAVEAGITNIVIVQGRGKTAIEDFFDRSVELEETLEKKGQLEWLSDIIRIRESAEIISIRQKQALGLGHAVKCGAPIIGNQPFAVLLPDELMVGKPNVTRQLVDVFERTGKSTVALLQIPKSEVSRYGICDVKENSDGTFEIRDVIEKPEPEKAPSQWMLPGRYLFTGKLFECFKDLKPGRGGEIQLTDAMVRLAQVEGLLGTQFKARRYDTGDKLGFLMANVELALEHPKLGSDFKKYLIELVGKLR